MVLKHPILTSPWNNWRGPRMLRDGRWSLPWLHPHDNAMPQQMPISPLLVHPLCTHALDTGTPHPHSFPWELWCPLCVHVRKWMDRESHRWTQRRHVGSLVPVIRTWLDAGVLLMCFPSVDPMARCCQSGKHWLSELSFDAFAASVGRHSPQEETMRKSNKRLNHPKVGLESLGMGETYIRTDFVLAWVYKWTDQGCRSLVSFQTINSSRKVGFYWNHCSAVYKGTTKPSRC